ncbi:MAG TPA: hypothetical protein PLM07_03140 [Candidatus Rifleibacterium sp.]|nr:hypothetical protein [Candidatus Rifleibacterium sp.]HPT44881.1 hypothetical protein [Candidatus Rifleibacterium sp.]
MLKKIFVASLLLLSFTLPCLADTEPAKIPDVEFGPWLSFTQGDQPNQLLWLSEADGNVVDGPFQGPMAFVTDRNGNLWAGDTLNARITAFTAKGRPIKIIDLLKVARQAGLANDPVLADIAPGMPGKLLVADAANNAIIEIDLRKAPPRAFLPASGSEWLQINFLHTDQQGKIYVEDVATRKTYVLDRNGQPIHQPLDGLIGIAVSRQSRIAVLAADEKLPGIWQILTAEKPGSPLQPMAMLRDDEPVIWAALEGYDASNRLHVIYDTPASRFYLALAQDGSVIRKYQTAHPEPGYDPARPDWVDANGRLYNVKIASGSLEIQTLK